MRHWVWLRFPNRFSSGNGHPCYCHRLEHDFLRVPPSLSFLIFASSLCLYFSFPFPAVLMCRCLPSLRAASSVQLSFFLEYVWFPWCSLSEPLKSCVLFHSKTCSFILVPGNVFLFSFFLVLLFSWSVSGALFSYPVRWPRTCLYFRFRFSSVFTVCGHRRIEHISKIRNQGGHWMH